MVAKVGGALGRRSQESLVFAALLIALLTSCEGGQGADRPGSSPSSESQPSMPNQERTAAQPTNTPLPGRTASSTDATPSDQVRTCATRELTVSLHTTEGGAGHVGIRILFENRASRACSMSGYPGVDGTKDGRVVVRARRTARGYLGGPGRVTTVAVAPNGYASALLEGFAGEVSGRGRCRPFDSLVITPPNETTSVTRATDTTLCYPEIHPVVRGRSGAAEAGG